MTGYTTLNTTIPQDLYDEFEKKVKAEEFCNTKNKWLGHFIKSWARDYKADGFVKKNTDGDFIVISVTNLTLLGEFREYCSRHYMAPIKIMRILIEKYVEENAERYKDYIPLDKHPEEQLKSTFSFAITESMHDQFLALCKEERTTPSEKIRQLVRDWIEKRGESMFSLALNEKYPFAIPHHDGVVFDYYGKGGATITAFFSNPSIQEIHEFRKSPIQIGITELSGLAFIGCKVGILPPSSMPYSIRLYEQTNFVFKPRIRMGTGIGITAILVDRASEEVKALRVFGASRRFTYALNQLVYEQCERPFNKQQYNRDVNRIYNMYSDSQIFDMMTNRYTSGELE